MISSIRFLVRVGFRRQGTLFRKLPTQFRLPRRYFSIASWSRPQLCSSAFVAGAGFYSQSPDVVREVLVEIASAKKWSDGQKELLRFAAERGSQGIPEGCHLFEQLNGEELMEIAMHIYDYAGHHGDILYKLTYSILTEASSKGNMDAKFTAAVMLMSGYGVEENWVKSIQMLKELDLASHPYAQLLLAKMYTSGEGVEQNFNRAFTLLKTSAMNMVPEAFVHLGHAYEEGRGCEVDIDEAVRCYRRGVELEHPLAYLELARCHTAGTGVEKSDEEAFKLHLKAAEAGDAIGLFNTGLQYFSGKGIPLDLPKAAEYFAKSSELGFSPAQINLGSMYYNGLGVEKDRAKAKELYRAASATNEQAKRLLQELEEEEKKQSS